jgi:hypothetical protein
MTVAELILELKYQPQDLEVSVIDLGKKRFKEHRDIVVEISVPELADPFLAIYLNAGQPLTP